MIFSSNGIYPLKYIDTYDESLSKNENKKAFELAADIVKKVIGSHADSIRRLRDPYEAGSYFLDYVSEAIETKEIQEKLESCRKELFANSSRDSSDFDHAVEWNAIDKLKELFKKHEI